MDFSLFLIPFSALVIISYSQQFKYLFFKKKKSNLRFRNNDFIYGIFFLTITSYLLNFLFPLKYFSLVIFIYGLVSFFYLILLKKILIQINLKSLFLIVFILILVSLNNDPLYDSKLYHYQIIKYNYEEKVIFGIVNIDPRLAFLSSWHQFISIFGFNNVLVSNLNIILYSFILNIIFDKNFFIKKISKIFLFCSLGFISFYSLIHPTINGPIFMSIGSPEVDIAGMLMLIYSLYLFLENTKNKYFIIFAVLLCSTIKLSFAGICLLIFYVFYKNKHLIKNTNLNLIIIVFVLSYLLDSYFKTGCLIFPITQTCFDSLWSLNFKDLVYLSDTLQNWAKDQPFRKLYTNPEHFEDFMWLKSWFFNYFIKTSYVQMLLFIFFLDVLFIFKYFKLFINLLKKQKILITLITLFFIILIWFQAPSIRYGYGILLALPIFFLSLFLIKIHKKYFNYIFNYKIQYILLCLILIKNLNNFDLLDNNRLFVLENISLKNYEIEKKIFNADQKEDRIYVSKSKDQFCYNLPQICTTYNYYLKNKNVYVEYKMGYKFYFTKVN